MSGTPTAPRPTISVVMAVHNAAPYLRQALASLRWQTFTDWECLCVDDGSTDTTPEILADFAAVDSRFRLFRQRKSGIVPALTLGDGEARSPWIARMDADDVALPHRLATQWDFVQRHPEVVGVGADVQLIDPSGAPIETARYAAAHDEIERRLLAAQGGTIAHPTLLFRHSAAVAAGGHRPEYPWTHDADLLLRLARQGRLANVPEVLLLYRQHLGNSCTTRRGEIRSELRRLLREQHAVRGGSLPEELDRQLAAPKRPSPMLGKWTRRAARNGFYQTAWQLWRKQFQADPASWTTARVTVEMLLRGGAALARGQRGAAIEVPDWRAWNCQPDKQLAA